MNEIKFRAWDNVNKEMLKVQELDFEDTFYGGRLAIRTDQYNDYFDIDTLYDLIQARISRKGVEV